MLSLIKKQAFRRFRKIETRLHELNYLFWECTTRCNLNCLHCGSDCSVNATQPDMPLQAFLNALDTIENPSEFFIVVFTGGEPLLRDDIEKCGREIRKRGMRWSIVTNGHLYNRERHNSLMNAGMGALTISLDGMEKTHNWLRNSSASFGKVGEAIEIAAGTPRLNFDVVTCVNKKNLDELPVLIEYLAGKGVKAWRLFTITPIGRASGNPDLALSSREFVKLMQFISSSRKTGMIDIRFGCEGYVGKYETKVRDSYFFCRAGINIGSILADGSISACPNINRSFVQGNIYHDNFHYIWQTEFLPFRNRSWTKRGKCAGCREYKDCNGNGLHNWHGDLNNVIVCHNEKIKLAESEI